MMYGVAVAIGFESLGRYKTPSVKFEKSSGFFLSKFVCLYDSYAFLQSIFKVIAVTLLRLGCYVQFIFVGCAGCGVIRTI